MSQDFPSTSPTSRSPIEAIHTAQLIKAARALGDLHDLAARLLMVDGRLYTKRGTIHWHRLAESLGCTKGEAKVIIAEMAEAMKQLDTEAH